MNALLTIEDIMTRYGTESRKCSRQTASKIVNSLPHFKIGKRLFVYEKDLAQYERDILRYPAVKPGRRNTPEPHLIPRRTA